jgi:hypothetical protein
MGINAITTRVLIRKADLILIYFGAVIPDIPWIIQRATLVLIPGINTYDLRLYCIITSSLFFSAILSAALANLFVNTKKTFIIFSVGSLIHLLLDSLEIKWANGVLLFVPIDWNLMSIGFLWTEGIPIYILTFLSFLYVTINVRESISTSLRFSSTGSKKIFASFIFVICYFSLPLLFLNSAEESNSHFVKTLREREQRSGKYFEIDRGFYSDSPNGDKFITPFDEILYVKKLDLKLSGTMSIKAKFISEDEIQIIDYHIHSNRDIFSYIGLLIILVFFVISLKNTLSERK